MFKEVEKQWKMAVVVTIPSLGGNIIIMGFAKHLSGWIFGKARKGVKGCASETRKY